MDDFREWLSDNLRYFMLGGAILLIILVLVFGIRGCAGCGKRKSGEPDSTQQIQEDTSGESSGQDEGDTDSDAVDPVAPGDTAPTEANPLVKNEEVTSLIEQYYTALGDKNIEELQTLVENLSPSDESKIVNAKDYIEGYTVKDVYTKQGIGDNSYVVYASYEYICSGIDTPVPALSQFYVTRDSSGSLRIDGAADEDSRISEYTQNLQSDSDVADLTSQVKSAYEQAQIDDPALADFLSGLGEDASTEVPAKEGTILTTTADCNVRAGAGSDEIIDVIPEGTQVEMKGQEGEWILIDYDGEEGYIYAELLE